MAEATREADDPPVEVAHVVALLRERLYGAISCLATLAILARYSDEDTSALARILDVAVATGGLWAAGLLSHWVAHVAVFGGAPRGREGWQILQASFQLLQAAVVAEGDRGRRTCGCGTARRQRQDHCALT